MFKPFYLLDGNIDLVKETKPFKLNEKVYVEKTYVDENGDSAVVAVPVEKLLDEQFRKVEEFEEFLKTQDWKKKYGGWKEKPDN